MSIQKANPPSAKVLMNSMRAMGYSFESAIADIIDNSISAHATEILLRFPTDPNYCFVTICGNGDGMNKETLYEAMKYGSAVNEERSSEDLGRFGLGLKSASLSQCKKLTVVSKYDGCLSSFVWDMDKVGEDWLIQELNQEEINQVINIDLLKNYDHGTLVVWENFDIIQKSTGSVFSTLNEEMENVSNYLSLIFHRYLSGEVYNKPINIKVNGYQLVPLDPFLEKHKKTNPRKEVSIPIKDSQGVERIVLVKPFVLPFQKDLSMEDKKVLGGIDSYSTKQGFYVYRNKRLIIWGTWFRMKPRNELTKYARIRVDIPNTLDDIWGIDIKKQTALLQKSSKNQLIKAVEEAMEIAIKAQKFRGRIDNINSNIDYIWDKCIGRNSRHFYRINRNNSIFHLLDDVEDDVKAKLDLVLNEIEQNIPYQQIYLDMCEQKIDDTVDENRKAEIEDNARVLIQLAINNGRNRNDAIDSLFRSEPFCQFPSIKAKLLEE